MGWVALLGRMVALRMVACSVQWDVRFPLVAQRQAVVVRCTEIEWVL